MSCLTVNVHKINDSLIASLRNLGGIAVGTYRIGADIVATTNIATPRINIKCGIICSIPESMVIRFAKSKLSWDGELNNNGVVLYNTLTATGEWSLEEIVIEELL